MASDPTTDPASPRPGIGETLAAIWRRRLVRWGAALLALLAIAFGAFWLIFARDLPSVD
jgi:penicillin-binding protein 1A